MKKKLLNLQMFGEGGGDGGSAPASSAVGTEAGGSEENGKGKPVNPLRNVVYGKQEEDSIAESATVADTNVTKSKSQSFEDLIKGEYKEEFQKRTQSIIDKRFKETKGLEEQLKSHDSILNMLSQKYGVDAKDVNSLQKAIEEDASFYEEEAMQKGLTVEQLKEIKRLQRENENLRLAQQMAEERANTQKIYSGWLQQAEELKAKYGLENFDLETEAQNPEFVALLSNPNISVEAAYKAIHMDEMIGGAMAKTAQTVREQTANSIASRQARPSENGISSTTNTQFKKDVHSLTKEDRAEIIRRVSRGATITF